MRLVWTFGEFLRNLWLILFWKPKPAKGRQLETIGDEWGLTKRLYRKENEETNGVSVYSISGDFLGFEESDAHYRARILASVRGVTHA